MKMRPIVPFLTLTLCCWLTFSFIGCGGGSGSNTETTAQRASVSGVVSGSGPLEDVKVVCGDDTETTGYDGFFTFPEVVLPESGRVILTYEKPGYATYQHSILAEDGGDYFTSAELSVYDLTQDYPQDEEVSISYTPVGEDDALLKLEIPANAVQGAALGDLEISVVYGDPSTPEGRAAFPGDYMAAPASGMAPDTPLESVAFAEVTIVDSEGFEITGDLAEPATLTLRLPEPYQIGQPRAGTYKDGDLIEWWSYDEFSAAWIQEDADPTTPEVDKAVVVSNPENVLYAQGKVSHFTWWNADLPLSTHACLCLFLIDKDDNPIGGIHIGSEGVSYDSYMSSTPVSNALGKGCVDVKLSTDPENPEEAHVYALVGALEFPYDVTDAAEGVVAEDHIYTPTSQGSTLDGKGVDDCIMLENPLRLSFEGSVHGFVVEEDTGDPVVGLGMYTSFGTSTTTDGFGAYSFSAPIGLNFAVNGYGLEAKWITLASTTPETLDFVRPNKDPIITTFSRTPSSSTVMGNSQVTFSALAMDPDGDPITYSWSATAGSPTTGSGIMEEGKNVFSWLSPSTAQTVDVTLAVRDNRGGVTSKTVSIVVDENVGDELMVIVLDGVEMAFGGAYVVLHGADNISIEQSGITDSGGVVTFGDVGRERVSLTVGAHVDGERRLYTAMGIPAGQIVIYLREDDPYSCTSVNTTTVYLGSSTPIRMAKVSPANRSAQSQIATTNITIPLVPVCEEHLQAADGYLSLLGWGYATLAPTPTAYGYLLNQAPTAESHSVGLGRTPVDVDWTINPATSSYVTVAFSGVRDGVSYSLASGGSDQSAGTVKYPVDFPVDYHLISASTYGPPALTSISKNTAAIEAQIALGLPDYQLTDFVYNEAGSGSFSWTLGGASARDAIVLEAEFWVASASTKWSALISPDATSWTVPELPAVLQPWIDLDTASGDSGNVYLTVYDYDAIENMDELYGLYSSGGDPEIASDNILSAMVSVYIGEDPYYPSDRLDRELTEAQNPGLSGINRSLKRK